MAENSGRLQSTQDFMVKVMKLAVFWKARSNGERGKRMSTADVKRNRVSNPKKSDVQKDRGDGGCTVVEESRGEMAEEGALKI